MALGLVKTNRLGVFAFEGSGLKKLMIVNFIKDIIFIHIKSSELSVGSVASNLIKGMK